jgi:ATP synthase protein I
MSDDRSPLNPGHDADGSRQRLDDLGARLQVARGGGGKPQQAPRGANREIGLFYRAAIELIVGPIVGGFMGWWLDSWLQTKPYLLIVMIVMGFAAGILNVVRTMRQMQAETTDFEHRD